MQKRKWSLFASLPVSSDGAQSWPWAFSTVEGHKEVMKKQNERNLLLPACEDAERDLLEPSALCLHWEMSCSSDVSNYASFCWSTFVPAFLQILSGECADIVGVLGSWAVCFH